MSYGLRSTFGFLLAACLPAIAAAQIVTETVSFQQGTSGYAGTVGISISPSTTNPVVNGATDTRLSIDAAGTNSSRRDVLLRFDNIVGDQLGQIPPGATILSAQLHLYTADVNNAQTTGPIGVAKLLRAFDPATTTFTDPFGTNGPDWAAGEYDRWVGGYEGCPRNAWEVTAVAPIVQAWANGEANYGFILRIVPDNAWIICSHSNGTISRRPKLIVEFTRTRSRQIVFQEGVDGYTGTSMLRMQAPTSLNPTAITTLGTAIPGAAAMDGGDELTYGLIKFDGVFGSGPNQVSPGTTILKAYVTLHTAGANSSTSRGRYDFHRLLMDVDWAGDGGEPFLWTDFINGDGPTEADSEIGPVLASTEGILWNSQPWVDITDAVEAWQNGETNYGLVVKPGTSDNQDGVSPPDPTTDGWEIDWLGTSVSRHPQLILVVPSARADLSGDGYVNDTDMGLFDACAATSGPAIPYTGGCNSADLDYDKDIDQDDYGVLQACFSGTALAKPECR